MLIIFLPDGPSAVYTYKNLVNKIVLFGIKAKVS